MSSSADALALSTPIKRDSVARSWFNFFRHNPVATLGLFICLLYVLAGIFAPAIAPYDPTTQSLIDRLQSPSSAHLLGTDELGRDIWSRIIFGAQTSLVLGLGSVGLALLIGVFAGVVAAFYGSTTDLIVMRVVDILLTLPEMILAISIVAALGPGLNNLILAVGISAIPAFARLSRAAVLTVKEQEFILAARAVGTRDPAIIIRHILPNALAPIIVQATLAVGTAILASAALSFLGLGVQPPAPEWGAMLSRGRDYIALAPHVIAFPGLALAIFVMSINLFGDGLRDALDPRLRKLTRG